MTGGGGGDGGVASEEKEPAKTLGGGEMGLGSRETQEMRLGSSEDKSDPMETTQADESGCGTSASKNRLREDSPLTPLNFGSLKFEESVSSRYAIGRKRILMEIFSVEIFERDNLLDINQILDENITLTTRHNRSKYNLYDASCNKNIKINSEGHLMLQWPECAIEVKDLVTVYPCYTPDLGVKCSLALWSRYDMPHSFDLYFTSKVLDTRRGFLAVNYGVYNDGLEAKIDVALSNLELPSTGGIPLKVYGIVTTSNSAITHSQAKSILFDQRTCTGGVDLACPSADEAEISLPLSRRVTAIPRQSNLIVDVNLFVRDKSIVNSSIIFHAKTRSNTIAEEHIIFGNHGKVKIKVTWMEAVDDGGSAKEEEDMAVGWVEEEYHVENEDDEDAESDSESDFDDVYSNRSHKMQRLDTEEDMSHRSTDITMTDFKDGKQEASLVSKPKPYQRLKQSFLEIFSIKIVGSGNADLEEIYGLIMIGAATPDHLLFRRLHGDPPKINSQGFALLEGPRRLAWFVWDEVLIIPFLFKYQDFNFVDKISYADYLWHDSEYDRVLHKVFNLEVGHIEVDFAVYEDGLEAHLEIKLLDCSFSSSQVHGTITATNSMLEDGGASSISFEKELKDVDVRPIKEVALPLSKPIIAVPFGSTLMLVFNINSGEEKIDCQKFQCLVEVGKSEQILAANGCLVEVKVNFFDRQPLPLMDYQDYF